MLSDFNPVFYSRCRDRLTRVSAVCLRHVRVRDLFEKVMSVSACMSAIWKFFMSVSAIQNFVISVSASADIGGQACPRAQVSVSTDLCQDVELNFHTQEIFLNFPFQNVSMIC